MVNVTADGVMLTMATAVVASERQICCAVGDEAVLLSADKGEYFGLNPVAASVWNQISVPCTLEMVRDALLAEYRGVSPDECEQAVLGIVAEMLALGIAIVH